MQTQEHGLETYLLKCQLGSYLVPCETILARTEQMGLFFIDCVVLKVLR